MGTYSDLLQQTPPKNRSNPAVKKKSTKRQTAKPSAKPRNRETDIPLSHGTAVDTTTPRYHDTMIETLRKAVKEFGKEAATHRFTEEEKRALSDIIYAYHNLKPKITTSENEITRIAINYIIEDYRENGKNSILDRVLQALNQ